MIDGKWNGPTVETVEGRVTQTGCYLKGKMEWVTTTYKPNGESVFQAFFHAKSLAALLTATSLIHVNATSGQYLPP